MTSVPAASVSPAASASAPAPAAVREGRRGKAETQREHDRACRQDGREPFPHCAISREVIRGARPLQPLTGA